MTYIPEPQWKLPAYTWGEDQKKCQQCKHYVEGMTGPAYGQTTLKRCRLNTNIRAKQKFGSCIDMRYEGLCGPTARLFKPK